MSRRREEAELQRVLQLSTQQAKASAALPPYTLSSASTDDSRDMELRPVNPSTGHTLSTPHRPAPSRSSYLLSPDPEEGDYSPPLPSMPKTRVEVVIPSRSTRRHSPDPIDALDPSELFEYRDIHYHSTGDIHGELSFAPIGTGGAPGADDALLGPSGSASAGVATGAGHVPSSGTDSSRRTSARQQTIKEKKAAEAAERKRKRAVNKAKEKAAAASAEDAAPAPKRRTTKANLDQATADDGLTSTTCPAPQRQGLEESAPRHPTSPCSDLHGARDVAPRVLQACTAAWTTMTAANAAPEACSTAREARVRPGSPVTEGVISSVEPESTSTHSSPRKFNQGSPVRSSPDVTGKDPSSPATAVTPNIARVLRPAHNTPPTSSSTPSGGRWRTRECNRWRLDIAQARAKSGSCQILDQGPHANAQREMTLPEFWPSFQAQGAPGCRSASTSPHCMPPLVRVSRPSRHRHPSTRERSKRRRATTTTTRTATPRLRSAAASGS